MLSGLYQTYRSSEIRLRHRSPIYRLQENRRREIGCKQRTIIFVADGNITEEGTHESLLALGGEYAKLFEVQSRYYQEGKEF